MSKMAGFALIVAGLGVGIFAIASSNNPGEQPEAAQSPMSGPVVSEATLLVPRSRASEALTLPPPFVVTVESHIGNPRIPQERLAIPKDRDALTRELQKELRRVGCYEGDISGAWTQSTRRAMKIFIERMNARLPIEEPNVVLYALVKGQHELVCGKACSHGEMQSAEGRCVPSFAFAAQVKSKTAPSSTAAVEKPAEVIVGGLVGTTPQSTEPSLERRMGLAGPSAPRDRAIRAVTRAGQPRGGQSPRHWATSIFNTRLSNN